MTLGNSLDPSPLEWFNVERKILLHSQILPCMPLLEQSNLLAQIVNHFIIKECTQENLSGSNYLDWAKNVWGHQLDQLYLENKTKLDQWSYRLLRTSNQGLALELYHRLMAKEVAFEEISIRYGEGHERFTGGFSKLQNCEDIPQGIVYFLRNLELGQCSKPISIKDKFGILQLVDFIPAVRGEDIEKRLLERQFQFWLNGMSNYLCDHLKFEMKAISK